VDTSWIPIQAPSLPLPDAPAGEGEGLTVRFTNRDRRFTAGLYNGTTLVDQIRGASFMEVHEAVALNYPQARWSNPNE